MTISSAKKYFELFLVAVYTDNQFLGYHTGRIGDTSTDPKSAKIYTLYRYAISGATRVTDRYKGIRTRVIPIDCEMAFDPLSTDKSLECTSQQAGT